MEADFQEFNPRQREVYAQAVAAHSDYLETLHQSQPYRGGMHWKKIRGREYLYRYRDRYGHGRSLGPRSSQTEAMREDFARQRQELATRLASRRLTLAEQARFCRAAQIQRVPVLAARILARLAQSGLGSNLVVLGAQAIHAYEFAAGAFMAGAEDLLAGNRRRLVLAADREMAAADLWALLRQADRSFAPIPGVATAAVNHKGFRVELVRPGEGLAGQPGASRVRGAPAWGGFPHLLAAPKFSQVVIGQDGFPVSMVVPDPRALALHYLWRSRQEDGEVGRQSRDLALALAALILRYLPQYHFFSAELRLFPEEVTRLAARGGEGEFPVEIEY